jgi:hypothetical protein
MKNFSGKLIYGDAPTEQTEIEGLKHYGWSDAEIASMTVGQRRREYQEAMEILLREQAADQTATAQGPPMPECGGRGGPQAGTSTPPGPKPSPTGGAPTEQTEIEALKRYGWSEEQIADMSPAARRREFQEPMETGQSEPPLESMPAREIPQNPSNLLQELV